MLKLREKVHERFIKFITEMLFYTWAVECMALEAHRESKLSRCMCQLFLIMASQ